MNEDPDPCNRWQRASRNFRDMNPTLAVVGICAVFLMLVVLMLAQRPRRRSTAGAGQAWRYSPRLGFEAITAFLSAGASVSAVRSGRCCLAVHRLQGNNQDVHSSVTGNLFVS
jgi:hypothetical protein